MLMPYVWRSRLATDEKGATWSFPFPAASRYTHAVPWSPSRFSAGDARHSVQKVVLYDLQLVVTANHASHETPARCDQLRSRRLVASGNLSPAHSPRWPRGPVRASSGVLLCSHHSLISGELWWMTALLAGVRSGWTYALAVTPSLIGFAALLPWGGGWRWPHPSLVALGLTLLASPLVDLYLNRRTSLPNSWIRLRAVMASGLGLLTLLIAPA